MYSGIKFTNNASTQLTQTLLATDTVLYVGTNGASIFPKLDTTDDYFLLTLFDVNKNREVVKCTARTDDSCTIVRAQEGTTARTFQAGTLVELRLTANSITKVAEDASVTKPHASADPDAYGQATAQLCSHVKLTDNFELGTQAINGVICTPYALQQAVARLTSVAGTQLITASTTYVVPETGTYTIMCVGGGGNGGTGGRGSEGSSDGGYTGIDWYLWSGGGAGGGGAGQTLTLTVKLTKGTSIPVTVGGSGGNTSFGAYLTALAGGPGNNGGNASGCGCNCGNMNDASTGGPGGGGAGGYSYGSLAVAGASGTGGNQSYAHYNGGVGGNGGVSQEGTYGNGGKGGDGQLAYNPLAGCDTHYGPINVGAGGTQGCVKITMKLGS